MHGKHLVSVSYYSHHNHHYHYDYYCYHQDPERAKDLLYFCLWFRMWTLTDHISETVKDFVTFNFRVAMHVIIFFPDLRTEEKWQREKQLKEVAWCDCPNHYASLELSGI